MNSHTNSENYYHPGCYAAIDIGTVTCRLLIASVDEQGNITEKQRAMAICDLGQGVDETHQLNPAAIERVGEAIDGFVASVKQCEAVEGLSIPVMVVATSATRDAKNASALIQRLAQAGVTLQVIPGEKEAELSFMGTSSAFPGNNVVVIDPGGGSTEIIAGQAGLAPSFAHSFNVGCRRLTDRFLKHDPPLKKELEQASQWVAQEMSSYIKQLHSMNCFCGLVIAVAGTATSMVSIREKMAVYDPKRVHGSVVTRDDVNTILQKLASISLAERQHIVGLEPKRAPVIVAGTLILQQIMELSGVNSFIVSESDILQGIILNTALHS